MDVWHIFIVLHALAATVSAVVGLALISPVRAKQQKWLSHMFIASTAALIVFMVAATASHWQEISVIERIIYPGLAVLGMYMLYRAIHAFRLLRREGMALDYIDDVGFVLISLFNGFAIVGLIDLGMPGWVVGVGAVVAAVVGVRLIERSKRKARRSAP